MTTEKPAIPLRSFSSDDARRLLRAARTASLGTLNRDGNGPYVSVVNVATDHAGWPFVFISKLAWHTQNILMDQRASILVSDLPATGDALTGPRVTLMGIFEPIEPEILRRRYLARHPDAAGYIDFSDFSFWRLRPERVHAVAGFGRIETFQVAEIFPCVIDWQELEDGAIRHMNEDHHDAVQRYATSLLGAPEGCWSVVAVDPDGCDLASEHGALRLAFSVPAYNSEAVRMAFIDLSERYKKM